MTGRNVNDNVILTREEASENGTLSFGYSTLVYSTNPLCVPEPKIEEPVL